MHLLLAAYQSTSNSNYSVTTSPTSPLHTTSAFFVWLKTFSDYVFQVNKKNVNGRQLKFLCVAICGDGPTPSFNQRLCAMLTFYGSTYQSIHLLPKLSSCTCFRAMMRTHLTWEKPVKSVNSISKRFLTDRSGVASGNTYCR